MNDEDKLSAMIIDESHAPKRNWMLPAMALAAGFSIGALAFYTSIEPHYVNLTPEVVVTYYQSNVIRFRIGVTNNYIFQFSANNPGTFLKFDWFYGQHNAMRELDMNMR